MCYIILLKIKGGDVILRILIVGFIILFLFGALLQMGCPKKEEAPPPVEEEAVAPEEEEVAPPPEEVTPPPAEEVTPPAPPEGE